MHSKIVYLTLFIFCFVYTYSLFPVFSTGDGGGLITASHLLGIAHPPGYPLYLELSKLVTFIPIANIGIKIGILSVFFSVLSLYLVYLIVFKITDSWISGIISVLFIGSAYSFYYNSTVEKFYTLNLFFILLLVLIGLKTISLNKIEKKYMLISSFLLGLLTSIHHTGLLITLPLVLIAIFYIRDFIKYIFPSIFLFLIGFLVNIHLYIRSIKDTFAAAHKADSMEKFIALILRKFYGSSSSIDATASAIGQFDNFVNSLKNLFYTLTSNLSYGFIALSLAGLYFLYRKDKKIFLFFVSLVFMYGIFLGKITLSSDYTISLMYVSANQYFLPLLAVVSILMGVGIFQILYILRKIKLYIAANAFAFSLSVLGFFTLYLNFNYMSNTNNWVPYYHGKDTLSILPVSSVISTYGDNHTFELWYLKLVSRFRDDVCHITSHYYDSTNWRTEGCKPKSIYKPLISEFFDGDFVKLSQKNRFLSTVALSSKHPLNNVFYYIPYEFIFFYIPKNQEIDKTFYDNINIEKFKLLTPTVCLNHNSDDLFTMEMCRFFSNAYLAVASSIKPMLLLNNQDKVVVDASIRYGSQEAPLKLEIYKNYQNQSYIEMYSAIRNYNSYSKFYLYDGDNINE